jgi:hypothetical protein
MAMSSSKNRFALIQRLIVPSRAACNSAYQYEYEYGGYELMISFHSQSTFKVSKINRL